MSLQFTAIILDVKITNLGFDLIRVHPPAPSVYEWNRECRVCSSVAK